VPEPLELERDGHRGADDTLGVEAVFVGRVDFGHELEGLGDGLRSAHA
jgi:hypothetical protein